MPWKIVDLPRSTASVDWLQRIRHLPRAFLLQSGTAPGQRYDILGADPNSTLTLNDDGDGTDPFAAIEAMVEARRPQEPCPLESPFAGGMVGSFGYELAHGIEQLGTPLERDADAPVLDVGLYDWFILIDHERHSTQLVATPNLTELEFERVRSELTRDPPPLQPFRTTTEIRSVFSEDQYFSAANRILDYIKAGDCYQVNLTQRFEAGFSGDPVSLYSTVSAEQNAPFSACLLGAQHQILSFSPERLLRVNGSRVLTQPIKGTRPRGRTEAEDRALIGELLASEKDRAENLMIVDLLRNDLGRCCVTGSIQVERLFELQSFRNVHHLVSAVTGELRPDVTALALLRSCFPGGSVTGAPKIRAMEIIRELEPVRRGPYCGAIGYYSYSGDLDMNLPIRTLVCGNNQVRYWGGGGIVADSDPALEYEESLAKVDFIRAALEQPRQSSPAARRSRQPPGIAETL